MAVTTLTVRVGEATELADGVRGLTLVPVDGRPLPTFSPGSHVVVHLPGDDARRNPYSLACPPWSADAYRIAVRRVDSGRGGSVAVHELVATGDQLEIEAPRNLFAPVATARRHVLIAGGIGITPFVSYAHQLVRDETPFELHYAFRDTASAALLDELAQLCPDRLRTYADADGTALLAGLDDVLGRQPLGTHLSVCGPAPMMDAVLAEARRHGWPPSRLHLERFAAQTGVSEPFDVVLASSGRAFTVPAGDSLLETLERAELEVPYMCRQGVCGACRLTVLAGVPDHRDLFLTPAERAAGTAIMPCVSRCSTGPLVLDLA